MTRNKIFIITSASLLLCWLVLSMVLGTYEEASDGFTEMGLPFAFFRGFSGKCSDCPETRIVWKGLIADLVIVLMAALLVGWFVSKRRRAEKDI